jgi:hypothetical protein
MPSNPIFRKSPHLPLTQHIPFENYRYRPSLATASDNSVELFMARYENITSAHIFQADLEQHCGTLHRTIRKYYFSPHISGRSGTALWNSSCHATETLLQPTYFRQIWNSTVELFIAHYASLTSSTHVFQADLEPFITTHTLPPRATISGRSGAAHCGLSIALLLLLRLSL